MLCSVPVLAVARLWLSSQFELLFVFGSGLVVRFVSLCWIAGQGRNNVGGW
jgi:hypothetical protein